MRESESSGRPDPLATFDLAYLTETYRQIAELDRFMSEFQGRGPALRKIIGTTDGYALVRKVLVGRGTDDPAMEFAAALMRGRRDDGAFRVHAAKARAGAARDALLARNLGHIS